MDNAGNCNTTAVELKILIPTFGGAAARLRCILHILNLIAKVCGSFVAACTNVALPAVHEEAVADDGEDLMPAEELAQLLDPTDGQAVDQAADGQDVHDTHVARSVRARAIASMALEGVVIDPDENRAALGLFLKVLHDSGTVADTFNSLVDAAKTAGKINSDKTALDRRCPTRWNSDLACIDAHNILRVAVEQLTATSTLKLSAFKFTEDQWALSDEVTEVHSLFDEMTLYFSQAETPLISDRISALEDLIYSLKQVRDDEESSNIVRVAACAAVMVAEKYFSLNEECEVYAIAIIMSPDKKLDWFRTRKWPEDDINHIKDLTIRRWEESYKGFSSSPPVATTQPQASTSARATGMSCNF
ncbi:hypothetical protein C8R44DRAFT_834190 [Mycena epipterygia]|nr:hypothetical protein C8R44DRAFT_834190 [Mycena epipterygia]